MANPISNDNFLAHKVLDRQKPDAISGHAPERSIEKNTPPQDGDTDVSRAHHRLSLENGEVRDPTIVSVREAGQRVSLLKNLMNESPAAAMQAHGNLTVNVFEAAMARPAA